MVHKATKAYALLHEWHTELSILEELLLQVYWLKGKQASWYERRALILERYIEPYDIEKARKGIIQALADEHTGISTSVLFFSTQALVTFNATSPSPELGSAFGTYAKEVESTA
jgi:hypothetical protein